ncbi:MAG: hypothetical protein FWE80_01880 [Oscillospiraceae bacterium]|nr:hypothetical protein [Oscillospiraceae bacterium]
MSDINKFSPAQVVDMVRKGTFVPNMYLSNVALAYFQADEDFISRRMFPSIPVALSKSHYYIFDKDDLTRLAVGKKPSMGSVTPGIIGKSDDTYSCDAYQVITGIDQIEATDYIRTSVPGSVNPLRSKAMWIAEQLKLFTDYQWARSFFVPDKWGTVLQGVGSTPGEGEFWQFDNSNSDPIEQFNQLRVVMRLLGLRFPNRICFGVNAWAKLKTNPAILERIVSGGSTPNPANVTKNVVAQLFDLEEVLVGSAVINTAAVGQPGKPEFIVPENDALLVYAPSGPAIDVPSAGYTFSWDMGLGTNPAVQTFQGPPATHTEFAEGMISYDMKVTSPDLGIYMKDCVSAPPEDEEEG